MGLLRILIDGYSLLHAWPEVAAGCPRHSGEARDELVRVLTNYGDMVATPVTVFFDGGGAPKGTPKAHSDPNMEVIYSPAGKTADDLIERVAYKLTQLGEVLVVTNDHAERDIVSAFGALARSCEEFILDANDALAQLSDAVKRHNRQEQKRFKNRQ
jgi:predicted RNA-binding protein with PIN domain